MPPLPPGAVTNVPAAPPASALYVFLLDSLNTEPQDVSFIHGQILSFLQKLDPAGTHVAVFSLGSSLRLLQGFTSDSAALLAAVSHMGAERYAMAQTRSDSADDADATRRPCRPCASPAPKLKPSRKPTAQCPGLQLRRPRLHDRRSPERPRPLSRRHSRPQKPHLVCQLFSRRLLPHPAQI